MTFKQIVAWATTNITKSFVGLGNVNNTSDTNKPISTATQTALDLKASSTQGGLADSALQPNAVNASIVIPLAGTITVVNGQVTAFVGV